MATLERLHREQHKDLCVSTQFRTGLGYDVGAVMVLPFEITEIQRELPIVFRKHPETGQLFPNALLGFEQNENLLLDDSGKWQGNCVPLAFAKGPFIITPQDDGADANSIIAIDVDDARISQTEGERIFDESGELGEAAEKMREALVTMDKNAAELRKMVDAFLEADLIEPLKVEITFKNGKDITFEGAYTITHEKLQNLSGEQLVKLNETNYLPVAYFIASSLGNVRRLIDIKNSKL